VNRIAGQRVLMVGMGGLGCPAALALAQAGVQQITIADPDVVDLSNLHRQPWYRISDLGALKVEAAARRLREAFHSVQLKVLPQRVDKECAAMLFTQHDAVIDGTDDVETKFLLSDSAVRHRVPLVYGGVLRTHGQAMLIGPGGPCLRCLFEQPAAEEQVPSCARAGVLGTVAGIVGATQALLALSALAGEHHRYGRLIILDGWRLRGREFVVRQAPDCSACASIPGPTLGATSVGAGR
jgi:molybdopterin/thiamine biosynthesis adenylyltransferase